MNQPEKSREIFFKLLIPLKDTSLPNKNTIILCEKPWELIELQSLIDAPPYTCISYSWGNRPKIKIPGYTQKISARTIPVVETVINALQPSDKQEEVLNSLFNGETLTEKLALVRSASQAIWIDSLCCPQQQSAADICIQNMGEIYKKATQVFVVLNTACDNTVLKMSNKEPLNLDDYLAVANDDWIDRIWTYQEFANSQMMFIVSEDKGNVFISEHQFLYALMIDSLVYANILDINMSQKLERMQLLVAEQQIDKRSAFQVMSATQERTSGRKEPSDRINVMISVIESTSTVIENDNKDLITLVEYFMSTCERNDDYSFIFSTDSRCNNSGKKWRPTGEQMKPVISNVLTFGRGLSGSLQDTHLKMNNMCKMVPWKTNYVVNAIEGFIKTNFSKNILKELRKRGFTGCGECIKLEHGYFFPQLPHKRSNDFFVAISHDVKFDRGAPGLLLCSTDNDISQFCDIGVFIGTPPTIRETINVS